MEEKKMKEKNGHETEIIKDKRNKTKKKNKRKAKRKCFKSQYKNNTEIIMQGNKEKIK